MTRVGIMSTIESTSKIGGTTISLAGLRLVVVRKRTCQYGVSGLEARSISIGLLLASRLQTFRGVVNSWDATYAVLKITDDPPNLPAPVNPSTLPAPVPIITVLGPWQGTDSFSKKNQNVARLCDRSPHGCDHGDSIRHIIVKTVYAMRFSCSGVAVGQSQQIVKRI
jgi:hypothetical protein